MQIEGENMQDSGVLKIPKYSVSAFSALTSPVEVVILTSSIMPMVEEDGTVKSGQRPEMVMAMSPQAAKELAYILFGLTEQYEQQFGELRTEFLDRLTDPHTGNA